MPGTAAVLKPSPRSNSKIWFFLGFALLTAFVVYGKNQRVFDPSSPIAQHFAPANLYLLPHAVFATIALILGVFQFSNRLRAKYLKFHRTMGYTYAVCAVIAAPTGILVARTIGPPELLFASIVQSFGWLSTLAIALYCVRQGNIAQHRRWMIRSYPFAMVFSVARLFVPIAMHYHGAVVGQVEAVWATIAIAGIVPTMFLEWSDIRRSARTSVRGSFAD